MINITLAGISFVDLPYITSQSRDAFGQLVKGEEAYVVREEGEDWDSDGRPAYSFRLGSGHIGYCPLQETAKEEWIRAKDGYKKVWKEGYEELSKKELRLASMQLQKNGQLPQFHDWVFAGTETMRRKLAYFRDRCIYIEMVRDYLYCEIIRNHETPRCMVQPVYFNEGEGINYEERGDVCSVVATFDID